MGALHSALPLSSSPSSVALESAVKAGAQEPADVQKLRKVAQQFESILVAQWWSAMKEGDLSGLEASDPGHETLDDMGIQAMSTAIAGAGGLGIANMLVHSLLGHLQGNHATAAGTNVTNVNSKAAPSS